MALPVKLSVLVAGLLAGSALFNGHLSLAVVSAVAGWQTYRLGQLAVAAAIAARTSRAALTEQALLIAAQRSLITLQQEGLEALRTQALVREAETRAYHERASKIVGAAEMILNGRKT